MNCSEFRQNVDALAAGEVSEIAERAMREHADSCKACSTTLATAIFVAREISRDRTPEPDLDFETRILERALAGNPTSTRKRKRWATPLWSGAVAAALVIGIFLGGQWTGTPERQPVTVTESAPSVANPDGAQQKIVRLAFTSSETVDNVTLTLELPPNVELTPFPGRHRVSWKVSLKPGDNLLALPVNILFPGEGRLVAHLGEGDNRKTFRTDIGKLTEPSS